VRPLTGALAFAVREMQGMLTHTTTSLLYCTAVSSQASTRQRLTMPRSDAPARCSARPVTLPANILWLSKATSREPAAGSEPLPAHGGWDPLLAPAGDLFARDCNESCTHARCARRARPHGRHGLLMRSAARRRRLVAHEHAMDTIPISRMRRRPQRPANIA